MNNQLWDLLKNENLVEGELPVIEDVDSPWYIKVLLATSGWLAAIFLLGFLGFLGNVILVLFLNATIFLVTGIALLGIAFTLLHLSRKGVNEFVEHLAFAFSVAGQILLVFGLLKLLDYPDDSVMWLTIGLVEVALLFIMPNYVHRLVSAFIAAISFAVAIYSYENLSSSLLIYTAFLMLVTALLWLNEFKYQKMIDSIRATAYGFVLALVVITGTKLFMYTSIWQMQRASPGNEWIQPWVGEVLLSAVALFVVWKLLSKNQVTLFSTTWVLAMIGTLLLTFLSLEAHGLIVGVMILLLGFSASNRVLAGLGVISLLFYISSYYYLLDSSLFDKSLTLLVLGVALILGRWLMLKLIPETSINTGAAQ